jgi:hypothetical protein
VQRQEQYFIDQGIKQNRTMGGGSVRPAVLRGTNTIYRAGYIGCGGAEWGEGVSGVPRNFIWGGSKNSVEDRENGDLGAVAP